MIHLHCTKKLIAKLPLDQNGLLKDPQLEQPALHEVSEANPLDHWHANLVLFQGRQCLIFVHDATRFPLFIPAMKKADFAGLDGLFADTLISVLGKAGATEWQLDRAVHLLGPLVCDSESDRSVQGSSTEYGKMIRYGLLDGGGSVVDLAPYSTSVWLADTPMGIKGRGYVWPIKEMLGVLGER
ncbi:DUF6933 domain-containing protein [Alloalcanivorax xenomutans]|uniref:DUF6933 domain-containing protein n=1 Tax=Alloalcanivorax xenomutans TaxID=1094342 RepID=A0A9Q3ZFE5_9GAMM|nr:hypothetical protein [Alloalcanivorax xenomutans]ARB46448.1 hypothetical protein P40_14410 [Alloalcanivorax xenomutans]KYZ86343.1 hypothetical protein A3Q32_18080 [Alcanivorax sp. KX64203]MCE7509521.1 hypothetical protein [Alloalcanivorax xenomutans]